MSGDDSARRDARTERKGRSGRSTDANAGEREPGTGGDATTDDGGTDVAGTFEDLPVSASVVGGFGYVLVTYLVLGVALAFSGLLLLNLYGGAIRAKGILGLGAIAFLTLVGPVLGGPMGLWIGDEADGGLLAVPAAFLANAVGHFFMALVAAAFLALEFRGLELVDLLVPFFFAALFAGVVAAVTAGLEALVTRTLS